LRLRAGRPGTLPSPEEAADYPYTPVDREMIRMRQADQVIGGPEAVRQGLEELLERTGVDELMLTTVVHDHQDRLRSYELVAELQTQARRDKAALAH
jgi:alkanesulfonate monooxygenase SsuD/methylene tetrahydromethanopterin reductase-like flavin-dependent oxidoreductase (luciferase family)